MNFYCVLFAAAFLSVLSMGKIHLLLNVLLILAVLCVGVIYGVDVFFAVVGRTALAQSNETALTNVMGHIHETADAQMPVFGVVGILSTLAFSIVAGLGTLSSWLAIIALVGLLTQLGLYLTVAKPINEKMTEAAKQNQILADIRSLQERWDSVIIGRAISMTIAIGCLVAASLVQ